MAAAYLALSLFVGPRCHSITAFFAAAAAAAPRRDAFNVLGRRAAAVATSAISYFRPIQKRRILSLSPWSKRD